MQKLILVGASLLFAFAPGSFAAQSGLVDDDKIVFLGDSITQFGTKPDGYVALVSRVIGQAYPGKGIQVFGAGVSGNKVTDCVARLDRDVLRKQPKVVVIYVGINDVWHWTKPNPVTHKARQGTTAKDYEAGLRNLIQRSQAAKARVVLCTPTVIGEQLNPEDATYMMLEQFSKICRVVAGETGAQLLDLRNTFIEYLKEHNTTNATQGIITEDGVHLNGRGNRLVAEQMLGVLAVPFTKTTLNLATNDMERYAEAMLKLNKPKYHYEKVDPSDN